jgi:hypothetical protein
MPRRSLGPTHRVYLTLTKMQHRTLEEFAAEASRPPATFAAELLVSVLDSAITEDGDIDRAQIEATIRTLKGDRTYPANVTRWKRPIEAILSDRFWWNAWYPDLCALLGRDAKLRQPSSFGAGDGGPVTDREGYFDLLEFLFRALPGPREPITWRSMDYPAAAEAQLRGEGSQPFRPVWERVIRHVVVALVALEETQNPSLLISVEDQIRHGWLSTLLTLVGEAPPGREALPRLPKKRLV